MTFEESPHLANPAAAVRKDIQGIPSSPPDFELDDIQWATPLRWSSAPTIGEQTPLTPNDTERSDPLAARTIEAADVLQSLSNPPMNKWRLLSSAMMNFANGLNDSAPGALIP